MASSNTLGENTLGLDLEQANISSPPSTENKSAPVQTAPLKATEVPSSTAAPPSAPDAVPASPSNAEPREKKKPYVNPDRAATGGSQRDKLSDEALAERMSRIRENNEKIRQRKLDVQADEAAFKKTQQVEAEKRARTKKVQEDVNRAREQNALRKMNKLEGREWDVGKNSGDRRPQGPTPATNREEGFSAPQGFAPTPLTPEGSGPRGGGRGGGRGRGRGRGRGAPGVNRQAGPAAAADKPAAATTTEAPAPTS